MGFMETINLKRFAGLLIFSVLYFLFIPLIPYEGVFMAASYFLFRAGVWSSFIQLPLILIVIYLVVLYYWLLVSGFDKYLLKRKYHR